MEKESCSPVSFDHPPSAAELASFYAEAEQNDPRSLFYKRVLVRPKLPVGRMLLSVLLTVALCALVFLGVWHFLMRVGLAILFAGVTLLLICLIFARRILIGMVHIYQSVAPAKLRQRCRYEPSCSAYMLLAVEKYGFWRGIRKGLSRWRGCKPPNGGYDLP